MNNVVLVQVQHAASNARDEIELRGQRGSEVRVLHQLVDTASLAVLEHQHGIGTVYTHTQQSEHIGVRTQFTVAKFSI